MADTDKIALDVFSLAEEDTRLTREARGEYAGPCPGCGGTDRFRVREKLNTATGEKVWKWMCRNCHDATIHGWGDEIEYLRQFRHMSFSQAKAEVDGEIDQAKKRVNTAIQHLKSQRLESWQPPTAAWQDQQHEKVMDAVARLWSEAGAPGLAYLRERGLSDETIRKARLGFAGATHPRTHQRVPVAVIPWYEGNTLWRVQCRVILPDIPREERYFQMFGSSNGGLYLAESLKLKRELVLMVEGEFDALILAQECGDIAAVLATGSTNGARSPHTLARLAQCQRILVAYDSDQDGDKRADYWLERLENATRYRPLAHDVNAMHLEGLAVRQWIEAAIDSQAAPEETNALEEFADKCIACGTPVFAYTAAGDPYCQAHWPKKSASDQEHGTLLDQAPATTPGRVEQDHTDQAPATNAPAHHYTISEIAASMAAALPDFTVRVEPAHQLAPARPKTAAPYTPVTLPPLDRRICPFVCVVERAATGRTAELKPVKCGAPATHNGWCEEHQYSHALLELGAALYYRQVQVHEHRFISSGCGNWEAYAKAAPRRFLAHDLALLKSMVDQENKPA